MCRSIDNMFAIFCKCTAGSTPLTCTHHFRFKFFTRLWNFTNKYLVAVYIFFGISFLKNQPFAVITEICFGIIATKSQLLNISEMFFVRVLESVGGEW